MSVIFSRSCEYGIQAALYLSLRGGIRTPIQLRSIADSLDIPYHFLGKVLQTLARHGIIVSQKGNKGGFLLARGPAGITLMEIVEAIDGTAFLDQCMIGFPACDADNPCPAHPYWIESKRHIIEMLNNHTVEELGEKLRSKLSVDSINATLLHGAFLH